MSEHDPTVRLRHMLDYAAEAVALAAGKKAEDLKKDRTLLLALTRLLEVLGEAASRVPEEVRGKHPEIPWHKTIGMRNRLIHGYEVVNERILADTVTQDLPPLIAQLKALVR